jgi:hypothetical protein
MGLFSGMIAHQAIELAAATNPILKKPLLVVQKLWTPPGDRSQ